MPEHILFLTGKLAEKSLHRVLADMQPTPFTYGVLQIGINVAGLMTVDMIKRRVTDTLGAARVIVPGRCRGDLQALACHYGIPVERGPDELKDLPQFFGFEARRADYGNYDVKVFAEIVDATSLDIAAILRRARDYRRDGADVIDLGCLPNTPFPHLEQSVQALKDAGYTVSVDSVEPQELLRAGRSGADYLLSLHEDTLWIADEAASTPVLIPSRSGDMDSLARAVDTLSKKGRNFIADPILDPIHFGFTASILRYAQLRERFPEVAIMMGVGNLTELTDADTSGINMILMGIISELRITHLLTTQVSPHARRAIREADVARRIMHAARETGSLPQKFNDDLLTVHARKPFPDSTLEIAELAAQIKDPSFRIQVSEAGIHVYNRDGLHTATDPFELWPLLKLEQDAAHAFYMGAELARAQIAWQLGKRYAQDEELDWGCAAQRKADDKMNFKEAGTTLHKRKGATG